VVTGDDVTLIRQLIAENPGISRRKLSEKLCELWQWKQANGALRSMVCRGLLLMGYFSRMRINPPLILTETEARDGIAILDEVFAEVERAGQYRQ